MKKIFFIFLTIFLISCTQNLQQKENTAFNVQEQTTEKIENEIIVEPEQIISEPATKTTKQTSNGKEITYGYSDTNKLLNIGDAVLTKKISVIYKGDKIASINGDVITYDNNNRLSQIKTAKGNWYFEYVMNKLARIKLGTAGGSEFSYDGETIKSFTKGNLATNIKYDDKNRIRSYDSGDTEFIVGYWKDNKIISFKGNRAVQSLAVSYGPNYPPFQANIISDIDKSTFTSAYTDTLYSSVDIYLYCKYIYRPDLKFDPISYTLYTNYFGGNLEDYILNSYLCETYET